MLLQVPTANQQWIENKHIILSLYNILPIKKAYELLKFIRSH